MKERIPPLVLAIILNIAIFRFVSRWEPIDAFSQLLGFLATGLAGAIWFYLDTWLKDSASPNKKQATKADTENTPNQIVRKGCVARMYLALAVIVLALGIILILTSGE